MFSARNNTVGLISMPWAPPDCPPISLGILKSVLTHEEIPCDCHHLTKQFYGIVTSLSDDPLQRSLDRISYSTHTQIYNWLFARSAFNHNFNDEEYLQKYFALSEQSRYLKMRDAFDQKIIEIAQWDWSRYLILGFSCSFYQLVSSIALSKEIAKHHDVKIIFGGGGLHIGNSKELLRECPWIEAIFLGETEYAFLEAVRKHELGQAIDDLPGIVTREGFHSPCKLTEEQLNKLPMPNYDEFYKDTGSTKCNIEGSRGCWWADKLNCSFCGLVHHNKFKTKRNALKEVEYMSDRYGITTVEFCDLVPPRSLIEDLCSYDNSHIDFIYNLRVDSLSPNELDKLKLLKESGTKSVFVGIDSLHPRILKLMNKGHSVINSINLLKWGQYHNVLIEWFILFGTPYEKGLYYDEMCKLMRKIIHFDAPSTQPIMIAYNSPYHKTLGNLIPSKASKYIFPKRFDAMQMSWEFELSDGEILSTQIENYKHIKPMIQCIEQWRIKQQFTALIKDQNTIYDTRKRQNRLMLTPNQSNILDFCYIPQKKRDVIARYSRDEVNTLLHLDLIIDSDGKYLAITTPEASISDYENRFETPNHLGSWQGEIIAETATSCTSW